MDVNRTNKNVKSALGNLLAVNSNRTPNLVPPVLHEVGKLAAGVASVSTTSGSATGNPRNKCALQPGHSLMDWIRLGNSGKDLTGVGSKAGRLSVTVKELATHDKEDDCWLAIRGRVFNVTAYLPFHPGGVEELMKGAGKDATTIFDQVHPWVNYESILQKCVIGRLVTIDPNINKEELFFGGDNTLKPPSSAVQTPQPTTITDEIIPLPRFDWIQKLGSITIIFYTGAFSNPAVEISPPNDDNELNIMLTYSKTLFTNEIQLLHPVNFPCRIKVYCETGKVELLFTKQISEIWDNYGVIRQKSKQIIEGSTRTNYVVADKKQINHNTYLLKFERVDKYRYVIPIGKHVRVFAPAKGFENSRSYTAVPESLFSIYGPRNDSTDSLCLMVKRYQDGVVSKYVTDLRPGDNLCATECLGNFDPQKIEKMDKFLLLAAGTGLTPMLGLIVFLLERRIKRCQTVTLLLFNRTEEDICFRSQFEALSEFDKRLRVEHILSEPSSNWQGPKGRVTSDLIKETIARDLNDTIYTHKDIFSAICGPNPFVELSNGLLTDIGFSKEQIHCFQG